MCHNPSSIVYRPSSFIFRDENSRLAQLSSGSPARLAAACPTTRSRPRPPRKEHRCKRRDEPRRARTRYRIRRLTQWVLEPANVIRRPHIAELIMASGHIPASVGRTYDCTASNGSDPPQTPCLSGRSTYESDGVFGRPPRSQHSVEALRFRLMIDVVCVEAATSIRWRSAA